jgi:hypothetical protein
MKSTQAATTKLVIITMAMVATTKLVMIPMAMAELTAMKSTKVAIDLDDVSDEKDDLSKY